VYNQKRMSATLVAGGADHLALLLEISMTSVFEKLNYYAAVRDFDRARKKAAVQQLMARLTGKSVELLSYNEVHAKLKASGEIKRGLREIPLDAIVGSVGRYKDFTRSFLPKRDSDEERWSRVRARVNDMTGLTPIEVYKLGEVYFVKDGNHRVSVARQLGSRTITAYVTEVETRVPLTPDVDPDEIICKSRYIDFLEQTNLDKLRPKANLLMTFCGRYQVLLEQIKTHGRKLQEGRETPPTRDEVVKLWYEQLYLPVVKQIRELGILRNFPGLTETDIYVLFSERWFEIQEALGREIDQELVVAELAKEESQRHRPVYTRVGERLIDAIVPDELEDGPVPGHWRKQQIAQGRQDRLFNDYLVAISGRQSDWDMLDEVIRLAQMENDRLHGLHVVPHRSDRSEPPAIQIRDQFIERCQAAGISADFSIQSGKVADIIIKNAAWADVVVTALSHPPGAQPLARLSHGFNYLVQRCPRPILAIPSGAKCRLDRLLLAYDGSPKAEEALFVATYLASRWPVSLVVVTVETEHTSAEAMRRAQHYVEQYGVTGTEYVLKQKPIAEAIMTTAEEQDSGMLIMGGFGFRPMLHLVLGSTVDQILREFRKPILICR